MTISVYQPQCTFLNTIHSIVKSSISMKYLYKLAIAKLRLSECFHDTLSLVLVNIYKLNIKHEVLC